MMNDEDTTISCKVKYTIKYCTLELFVKYGSLGRVPMRPILAIAALAAASVLIPVLGAAAAVYASFVALSQLLTLEFKKFCKTLALMVVSAIALPLVFALIPVLLVLEIAYAPLNFFLSLASLAIGKIDLMRKQKNLASNISATTDVAKTVNAEDLVNALTDYSKKKTWCQSRESAAVEILFLRTKHKQPREVKLDKIPLSGIHVTRLVTIPDKSDDAILKNAALGFFKNKKNKGKRLYTLLEPVLSPGFSPA